MKSGMMAAETIADAIERDEFTSLTLGSYAERYHQSWAYEEHRKARNFHGAFSMGLPFFMLNEPVRLFLSGGRGLVDNISFPAGHTHYKKLAELPPAKRHKEAFEFDGKLTFSKEHLVQYSGTKHDADEPSHLVVADTDLCRDLCAEEYGNPCESFCPAAVYEMVDDTEQPGEEEALHPLRELRALQDVRHRRPVSGDHVDAARGRRGARLHADVGGASRLRGRPAQRAPHAHRAQHRPAAELGGETQRLARLRVPQVEARADDLEPLRSLLSRSVAAHRVPPRP